jgi:hypothetical protein
VTQIPAMISKNSTNHHFEIMGKTITHQHCTHQWWETSVKTVTRGHILAKFVVVLALNRKVCLTLKIPLSCRVSRIAINVHGKIFPLVENTNQVISQQLLAGTAVQIIWLYCCIRTIIKTYCRRLVKKTDCLAIV